VTQQQPSIAPLVIEELRKLAAALLLPDVCIVIFRNSAKRFCNWQSDQFGRPEKDRPKALSSKDEEWLLLLNITRGEEKKWWLANPPPIFRSSTGGRIRMAQGNGEKELSENRRKAIFRDLVDAQDHKLGVFESRKLIAKRFGLTEGQIRRIEQEGLDRQWLPL
jgi:hypothetical protein